MSSFRLNDQLQRRPRHFETEEGPRRDEVATAFSQAPLDLWYVRYISRFFFSTEDTPFLHDFIIMFFFSLDIRSS